MNIETLTVDYIRTGRLAADGVLNDDALTARLPNDILDRLERLRGRTCLPRDALAVMVPVQRALEEERVSVQRALDAMTEISRKRDQASSRLIRLRMIKDIYALFEAATHDLLDAFAAKKLKGFDP